MQLYHRAPEAYEFEAKNSLVCLEEPTGGGFACDDWPDDDPAADLFGMHWHRWHTDTEVLLFGVRIMTDTMPLSPFATFSVAIPDLIRDIKVCLCFLECIVQVSVLKMVVCLIEFPFAILLQDPEYPYTLEQLNVVSRGQVRVHLRFEARLSILLESRKKPDGMKSVLYPGRPDSYTFINRPSDICTRQARRTAPYPDFVHPYCAPLPSGCINRCVFKKFCLAPCRIQVGVCLDCWSKDEV